MPMIAANGVSLYYELTGDTGDPLVLVHGSWVDHASWLAVVPGLSRNHRVLSYDRRGHSKSEKAQTQGSFDEDADDLSALLSELGLAPAHVVGNSAGSIVALKLACRQPSALRSLVIHEPPLLNLPGDDPRMTPLLKDGQRRAEAVRRMLEAGDAAGGARAFVETLAFGLGGWERLSSRLRETFISNAGTWLDETNDPTGLTVDFGALERFRRPAMLTYGGKSPPFFRPIVEKVAGVIPGSRLESYPGDGHTPHISNPEEFGRRVNAFTAASG